MRVEGASVYFAFDPKLVREELLLELVRDGVNDFDFLAGFFLGQELL